MGTVKVELFEYALFVNHARGMTVIFPEKNHVLTVEGPGGTFPVTRGADMEMMGPGGAPLADAAPSELPGYGQYVLDLRAAIGPPQIDVALSLYTSAAVDPASINGRLLLKGGRIDGLPCSDPAKRVPYTFPNGRQLTVTDTAVFEMDIPDGEVAQLRINTTFIDVEDGTTIRIHNGDGLGCPPKDFWSLDEFVTLAKIGGYSSATAPTAASRSYTAQGPTNICLDARIRV